MSAPETNIETQKRRHRGPLIGMIVVVIFAVGLIVWWMLEQTALSEPPQGSTTQIDGRTGEAVEPPATAPADLPSAPPQPGPGAPPGQTD